MDVIQSQGPRGPCHGKPRRSIDGLSHRASHDRHVGELERRAFANRKQDATLWPTRHSGGKVRVSLYLPGGARRKLEMAGHRAPHQRCRGGGQLDYRGGALGIQKRGMECCHRLGGRAKHSLRHHGRREQHILDAPRAKDRSRVDSKIPLRCKKGGVHVGRHKICDPIPIPVHGKKKTPMNIVVDDDKRQLSTTQARAIVVEDQDPCGSSHVFDRHRQVHFVVRVEIAKDNVGDGRDFESGKRMTPGTKESGRRISQIDKDRERGRRLTRGTLFHGGHEIGEPISSDVAYI